MKARDSLTSPTTSTPAADAWATALVQRAARRSPVDLAARLEEEWLADLAEQPGALARLRFALGCCWAKQVISFDPVSFGVTAQRAASAHSSIAVFAPRDVPFVSRRALLLLLIVAMHGILIYGFSNGLGHKVFRALQPDLKGTLIEDARPPETPPQVARPATDDWTNSYRNVADYVPPDPVAPISETKDYVPGPVIPLSDPRPEEPHPVIRQVGGPGPGFPSTADFYPSVSRRLGETGATALQVCVDSHGRLVKEPEIRDSSGSARLDAGALALAKAGSGHYRSSTEDGLPVASCYAFRVRFQLRE